MWLDPWRNGASGRVLFEIQLMPSDLSVYKGYNRRVQTFAVQASLGHLVVEKYLHHFGTEDSLSTIIFSIILALQLRVLKYGTSVTCDMECESSDSPNRNTLKKSHQNRGNLDNPVQTILSCQSLLVISERLYKIQYQLT